MNAFKQTSREAGYLAACEESRSLGNQLVDFVDVVLAGLAAAAGLSVDAVLFESEEGAFFSEEESDFEAVVSAAGFAAPFSAPPLFALDDSAGGLLFFA